MGKSLRKGVEENVRIGDVFRTALCRGGGEPGLSSLGDGDSSAPSVKERQVPVVWRTSFWAHCCSRRWGWR